MRRRVVQIKAIEQDNLLLLGGLVRAQGSGFRVQGSGFRVQGSRVQGPGSRVQGSGFRVQGYHGGKVHALRERVLGNERLHALDRQPVRTKSHLTYVYQNQYAYSVRIPEYICE